MKLKGLMVGLVFCMGISLGGVSFGTPIDISGSDDPASLASFTGTLNFDEINNDLIISLTNTTSDSIGAITALGFLFPLLGDDEWMKVDSFDYVGPTNTDFHKITGKRLKGFDGGAGTGRTLWGGTVKKGIAAGDTATFTFGISTNASANFTSEDFVKTQDFAVVRFQGLAGGGSAKIIPTPGGGAQVPEPATIFLLGSGLLGLFGYRKKFKKSEK